jgi:hypothetical protein
MKVGRDFNKDVQKRQYLFNQQQTQQKHSKRRIDKSIRTYNYIIFSFITVSNCVENPTLIMRRFLDFDLYHVDHFVALAFAICVFNLPSSCFQQRQIHGCASGSQAKEVKTFHTDFPHNTWRAASILR